MTSSDLSREERFDQALDYIEHNVPPSDKVETYRTIEPDESDYAAVQLQRYSNAGNPTTMMLDPNVLEQLNEWLARIDCEVGKYLIGKDGALTITVEEAE